MPQVLNNQGNSADGNARLDGEPIHTFSSTVDSVALTAEAIKTTRSAVLCRGSDVFLQFGCTSAANTLSALIAFYDSDDKLLFTSPRTTFVSAAPTASLNSNTRYLTDPLLWPAGEAHKAVVYLISASTSETIDAFMWAQSEDVVG